MIKKQLLVKLILSTVWSVLIGLLFILFPILLPVSKLIRIALMILGVITIVNYLPTFFSGLLHISTPTGKADLFGSLAGMAVGTFMIIFRSTWLTILAAILLVILPILRFLFAQDRDAILGSTLRRVVLGVILIIFLPALMGAVDLLVQIVSVVIGVVMILVALVNGYHSWQTWKNFTEPNPYRATNVFVDSTGDGVVDTIMVDTKGTGKADTEIKYRHRKRNK